MKIIKTICDKCKSIISNEPEWVKKLEQGMRLHSWYEHNGEWFPRTENWQIVIIVRVDANMVYHRLNNTTTITISTPEEFENGYTLIPQ